MTNATAFDRAAFYNLTSDKLSKMYKANDLRNFARQVGLNLVGDARKKGVKLAWVKQIQAALA